MPTPVKILHVVISLEQGGMENGIVNVANSLQPAEFDVHVCCLERGGVFVERMPQPEKVRVLKKSPGVSFSAMVQLARVIAEIRPDVIHTHNLGPLIYGGLSTGLGISRPVLHGEHSLLTDEECSPKRLRQRKLLYRACRKVHTVSEGLRQQLIDVGLPGEKIVTLLNGVDTLKFSPAPRETARQHLNLPGNAFMVGIVGRFGPFKRHAFLLEAFTHLAAQFPDLHLLVVGGSGPEKDRVHAQAEAIKAKDRIHFAGFQNNLPPFYRAMDLLIVPSINEGLSNAVLEAMSCGIPVLANNTCGNGEVIASGENGIVADLNSPETLRCELQKVLVERSRLVKLGQFARDSVVTNFSIAVMVRNYERLYRAVAGRTERA